MGVANGIEERLSDASESVPLRNKLLEQGFQAEGRHNPCRVRQHPVVEILVFPKAGGRHIASVLCRPPALSRALTRHHRGLTATADRMPASGLCGRLSRQLHLREFLWKKRQSRTRGFTLLELLIVIAIISLIVSLIIPAVQAARESARRTECQNNLRQFGIALLNHEAARKSFPPGLRVWAKSPISNLPESKWAFHGFMPELLPYLEQQKVAELYDGRKMFAAPENAAAVSTVLPVAICPSAPHANLVHEDALSPGALIHPAISLMEINHGSGLDLFQTIVQQAIQSSVGLLGFLKRLQTRPDRTGGRKRKNDYRHSRRRR